MDTLTSLPVLAALAACVVGTVALACAFTQGLWRLLFGAAVATVEVLVALDRATAVSLARAGQRLAIAHQRRALTRASAPREAIPMGSGERR